MGIPGLTSYVNNVSSVKLGGIVGSDLKHLVIDGNAFIYYIFGHYSEQCPSLFGGQYGELRKAFEEFLSVLKRNNIRPLVVFDGVDFDEAKRKTKEVRKRDTVLEVEFVNMEVDYTRVINQNWDTSELGHLVLGEYKGYELQTWTDL